MARAIKHPNPPRAPRVKTATEAIQAAHSSDSDGADALPYIAESSTFDRMLVQQRNKAERTIADLGTDIERLEAEIALRRQRKSDLEIIVARCDAAMGINIIDGVVVPSTLQLESEG